MRRSLINAFSVVLAIVASMSLAQEEATWGDNAPRVFAIKFVKTGHAASKDLEKNFAPVTRDYAEKDVLFLTVDVTTKGSRHQAGLLLNALGLPTDVCAKLAKSPGTLALVDTDAGEVVAKFGAKDDAKTIAAALEKALKGDEDEGMDEGEEGQDER